MTRRTFAASKIAKEKNSTEALYLFLQKDRDHNSQI